MNFDFPIEQLVRRTDTRFQLGFATEAKERVPAREEFVLSASRRGLHVLARNENGLSAPIEALRRAYGASLAVKEPQVRLLERLTSGTARYWIVLSHYSLVTGVPGGGAA